MAELTITQEEFSEEAFAAIAAEFDGVEADAEMGEDA